jgi:hypothetical protein
MKKALFERSIVGVLFILVFIMFSFAERDSKKLAQLYNRTVRTNASKAPLASAGTTNGKTVHLNTRN